MVSTMFCAGCRKQFPTANMVVGKDDYRYCVKCSKGL